MDTHTLHKAVDGIGGPKVTHHQKRTIKQELKKRRLDRMYAAELADKAQRTSKFQPDSLIDDQTVDVLDTHGVDDLVTDYSENIDLDTQPASEPLQPLTEPATGTRNTGNRRPELSEKEAKAALLVGAILYEAVVVKQTKDTIQAHLNAVDDIYLADRSIPEQITEYLWTELSPAERSPYLRTIVDGEQKTAIKKIEELCSLIGVQI